MTNLSRIKKTDVVIGKPLPWPIREQNRKLLLRAGFIVESIEQVEQLMAAGLYRVAGGDLMREPSWGQNCRRRIHLVGVV